MPASPNRAVVIGTPTKSTVAPEKLATNTPPSSFLTSPTRIIASDIAQLRPMVMKGRKAISRSSIICSRPNFEVTE